MIVTPRLRLRPLRADDAEPTVAMMSEAISRWTGSWTPDATSAEVLGRIERHQAAEAEGRAIMRAIEGVSDGRLMGWIGVDGLADEPRRGVLGYWLGEAFWGRGHAGEAAAAMVGDAWDSLDLDVIEAGAQRENAASIAILRRLGMTEIGERSHFASARGRDEVCLYFEIRRPPASI